MANTVLVETSARHVHLTEEHIKILFGEGATLTVKKPLSQPGQFACEERVTLVGPKKSIPNVIILGPARSATQVEVSLTDARTLGVDAPVRESGDIAGSGACKIVGPCGEVEISEGVIAAKRHIHLTPADAEAFGVEDKQIVSVKINSADRRRRPRKPQIRRRYAHRYRRIQRRLRFRQVLRGDPQVIFYGERGGDGGDGRF